MILVDLLRILFSVSLALPFRYGILLYLDHRMGVCFGYKVLVFHLSEERIEIIKKENHKEWEIHI
jgi:hypothetical protein